MHIFSRGAVTFGSRLFNERCRIGGATWDGADQKPRDGRALG